MSENYIQRNQPSLQRRIAILSIVANFVTNRGWNDYDGFIEQLTDEILRRGMSKISLKKAIFKMKTPFFRLNGIDKSNFCDSLPWQRLERIRSRETIASSGNVTQIIKVIDKREPRAQRIYIDDIDSFAKVRNVNANDVIELLPLTIPEKSVKEVICELTNRLPIPKDWGGESEDVYSEVRLKGKLMPAAFMLKGSGTKGKLVISKCGKNGDQILRLATSPANLFVVQHIDEIDPAVIKFLELAIDSVAKSGKKAFYCVMDGIATARLLRAYNRM